MVTEDISQTILERFLRGELSQSQAVEALVGWTAASKAAGVKPGALRKPEGMSQSDYVRAEALMNALNDRFQRGQL